MLKIIKKVIIYLIVFWLVSFCILVVFLMKEGRDAAILMYHSVGEPGVAGQGSLDIPEKAFARQMAFLSRYRYHVIPLSELEQMLREKKKIPAKTVVLTFDDGYENNYTKAFPILKKYHFPATFFIITNFIGKEEHFYDHYFKFMTPAMIVEMANSGLITIGSHSMNHPFLPMIKDETVLNEEIAGSKKVLERLLHRPVKAFCYPVGGFTPHIEELVRKAGYSIGVTTYPRRGFACDDIYALKRIKVTDNSTNPFVFFVETSGYFLRIKETNQWYPKSTHKE